MNKEELNKLIESEGDFFEWTNILKCHIQRNSMGSWCGYTTIPKSFPVNFEQDLRINCHGGVTYQSINPDGDLVVGFDCAHFGDCVPKYMEYDFPEKGSVYRDKKYVIDEVNSMVEQILNIVSVQRHLKINTILKK